MKWTAKLIEHIKHFFPKQRGTVEVDHLTFLQTLQYITETGCRWRALPEKFGKWGTRRGNSCRCGTAKAGRHPTTTLQCSFPFIFLQTL
jgi:transposase